MHKPQNNYLERSKKANRLQTFIILCFCITGFALGWWWQSILFIIGSYALHEILCSDHLFYNPGNDYLYNLKPDYQEPVKKEGISSKKSMVLSVNHVCNTWLCEVQIKADIAGCWFDPHVIITDGKKTEKQYFERRLSGRRYVNISSFSGELNNKKEIHLNFKYCCISNNRAEMLGFIHSDYTAKRLLIIAPHADDAEIAAFGLYSQADDVHIVTLSAGEVEMDNYLHVYSETAQASILKGRLRAMDSIAVPLWGGVKQQNCIHLGYFCKRLSTMASCPDKPVGSLTADLMDTRVFRAYNTRQLTSDDNGQPTWNNLIQDLAELVQAIKPEVIVTAHPELDAHPDHVYGTKALAEALKNTDHQIESMLYYANHYRTTDMFPFGPEHTVASLPPHTDTPVNASGVVSFPLPQVLQKNKIFALEMMHDLKVKQKFKKYLRTQLQRLIGRRPNRYGAEGYFRKAIKSNELFFTVKSSGGR